MEGTALDDLAAVFGPDLEPRGSTFGVLERHGLRSLGCYWAAEPRLFLEANSTGRRRVRFSFKSHSRSCTVPVTDMRLYAEDHVTPNPERIETLASELRRLPRVLVSIGLSRAYRRTAGEPAIHWLQINNIHTP